MNAPAILSNYTALAHAEDLMRQINDFLKDAPAVTSEDIYREGAKLSTLAGKCLADIDQERKKELAPLSLEVGKINHRYKERTEPFNAILDALTKRLTAFAKAEEDRRKAEAAEKRRQANLAQQALAEASARAVDALGDADAGVVGIDVLSATEDARRRLREMERAEREAARAERDTTFRVRSPGERAVSMRNKEQLLVSDPLAALTEMGPTIGIIEELTKAARAWRREHGRLPAGIVSDLSRSL